MCLHSSSTGKTRILLAILAPRRCSYYYGNMKTRHIQELSPALVQDLRAKGADIERTLALLDLVDAKSVAYLASGSASKATAVSQTPSIPSAGDPRVFDRTKLTVLKLPLKAAREAFRALELPLDFGESSIIEGEDAVFSQQALTLVGIHLYPRLAYGVLNGGSATTYIDEKKNRELDGNAFRLFENEFRETARVSKAAPKGVTPAFVGMDGNSGPSFLLLKMRSILLRALEYRIVSGDAKTPVLPFFQMTSGATDSALAEAYARYRNDPLLSALIQRTGIDPTDAAGAVQPMLAALSPLSEGLPRNLFDKAWGTKDTGLALPGGHGENFRVLADTYRALRAKGVRWAYLGNVDNSGYTVDPVSLAITALKGADAAFEFSWRTKMDVKGGVLVELPDGTLSTADIGQAISKEALAVEEAGGKPILFNCATGLFDLDFLVPRLQEIADGLPIRVSEQDKEAGRYAQAEQNTWEILGLAKSPLIFAVAKESRFVAAKMLMETLLSSPIGKRMEAAPPSERPAPALMATSADLQKGFSRLLEREYGFTKKNNGSYQPISVLEFESTIKKKY